MTFHYFTNNNAYELKEGLGDETKAQKGDAFIDFINVKSNIDTPTTKAL